MGTSLYVANLPYSASAAELRAHFGACGAVAGVEFVADRDTGRERASALVSMDSEAGAKRALVELNGARFQGQLLRVEAVVNRAERGRAAAAARETEPNDHDARARMTVQFREPRNMTYELDCAGTTLAIRVFFPNAAGEYRIVAQTSGAGDAPGADATAASRVDALRAVARFCKDGGAPALAHVDWTAVERAMAKVRAL